jgi:cellulose biosynthesis protein BcsQ
MNRVHVFQSVKGGVGCTTSAVGFACWLANQKGEKVTFIALNDDAESVLDRQYGEKVRIIVAEGAQKVNHNIVRMVSETDGYVVVDAGTELYPFNEGNEGWLRHLVTENHYLALRRATFDAKDGFDDFVLLCDTNSVLTKRDCMAVLRLPMFFSVDRTDSVSRSIDAGLFPRDAGQFCQYEPEQAKLSA